MSYRKELNLQPRKKTPRPYQEEASQLAYVSLAAKETPLIVCSTGGGKSIMLMRLAQLLIEDGHRVLVLFNIASLVSQMHQTALDVGIAPGDISIVWAEETDDVFRLTNARLCIAMSQTLEERMDLVRVINPTRRILDEAHRTLWTKAAIWTRQIPTALVTATPYRATGGFNLGAYTYIETIKMKELISSGNLVPYRILRLDGEMKIPKPSKAKKDGEFSESDQGAAIASVQKEFVLKKWLALAGGRPTFVAMGTQASCIEYRDFFIANGVPAAVIISGNQKSGPDKIPNTSQAERRRILAALTKGEVKLVFSVDALSTGVDCKAATVLMVLKMFGNLASMMQWLGRVFRTDEMSDKEWALIMDFMNNFGCSAEEDGREPMPPPDEVDWQAADYPAGRSCISCGWENCKKMTHCIQCDAPMKKKPKPKVGEPCSICELPMTAALDSQGLEVLVKGKPVPICVPCAEMKALMMEDVADDEDSGVLDGDTLVEHHVAGDAPSGWGGAYTPKIAEQIDRAAESAYRAALRKAYKSKKSPSSAAATVAITPARDYDLVAAVFEEPLPSNFRMYKQHLESCGLDAENTKRWLIAEFTLDGCRRLNAAREPAMSR